MAEKRLFVDMDGVMSRLHDRINYLERMFEKNFFRDLEPFENMVEAVKIFKETHPEVKVYVLSATVNGEPPYCEEEKHAWLDKHLPEIPKEQRIFTPMGKHKAEFVPGGLTKDDYLLDDYNKGLYQFMYDGGRAIKCHNNINQKGLGAYGGQRGNMWVGPMVHTDDKPDLIAAEISAHMGLEYDLNRVIKAYSDVVEEYPEINFNHINSTQYNPLNVIRRYAGNDDFYEVTLNEQDGFRIPQFLLTSICSNLYGVPDFNRMFIEPDKLYKDVKLALEQAKLPVIGQVNYRDENAKVKNKAFYTWTEMQKEIDTCKEHGIPIDVHWNIEPSKQQVRFHKTVLKKEALSSLIEKAENARIGAVQGHEAEKSLQNQPNR